MADVKRPNTISPHKTYASVQSVARRYDVSANTIWRWAREGNFPPPVKLGVRSTRWRLSDLEAWEAK
jgi:prophage regulatory protein